MSSNLFESVDRNVDQKLDLGQKLELTLWDPWKSLSSDTAFP